MEPSYIPVIIGGTIGLVSAVLAQTLTAVLNELKSRRDDARNTVRVLKTALYNQIELYGELLKLNQTIHEDFAVKFKDLLTGFGVEQSLAENFTKITPFINDILEKSKFIDTEDIGKRYEDIIQKVAEVDPLLAIKISQRVRLKNKDTIDVYFENLINSVGNVDPITLQFAHRLRVKAKQEANARLVESLEESIDETAKRINSETHKQISEEMKNLKDKIVNKKLEIVDQETDKLFRDMVTFSQEIKPVETNQITENTNAV
jgi:hypothetical protein